MTYKIVSSRDTQAGHRCFSFLLSFFILVVSLFFFTGCSTGQKAVSLYVDAVELSELGHKQQAVEKLNTAVELDGNFSPAYSFLGEIYEQLRNFSQSADSYEKATELNPWSFRDFFNLGRVYQIMEKFRQAAAAYARACELKQQHLEAHINAARCYYEIEDFDNAIIYGKRAEQIDPQTVEIHKILGDIFESRKDHSQAIGYYKRALEIDSNDVDTATNLAAAYMRSGQIEPAKQLLIWATNLQPDNNIAFQYLGYCYLQINSKAIEQYKQQKEKDPNDTELLSSIYTRAEAAIEKAVESYNRAIEINANDWQAYRGLGVAFMLRAINSKNDKIREKAVEQWRISLKINPGQPHRKRLFKLIERYSTKQ